MAQRLCFDERTRIEAMRGAQLSVDEIADRLGRHRSTVYRELARGGGLDGYCARAAHRQAGVDAARPKTPKLAGDPVLAGEVAEGLKQGWSPHAVSADLRGAGLVVCAETIYRACYANHRDSGLKADSWKELPRGRRRRKRRSRCEAAKRSVLGDYKPLTLRPRAAANRDIGKATEVYCGVGPPAPDRLGQAPQTVTAHDQRVGEAPVSQLGAHRRPLFGHRRRLRVRATGPPRRVRRAGPRR